MCNEVWVLFFNWEIAVEVSFYRKCNTRSIYSDLRDRLFDYAVAKDFMLLLEMLFIKKENENTCTHANAIHED